MNETRASPPPRPATWRADSVGARGVDDGEGALRRGKKKTKGVRVKNTKRISSTVYELLSSAFVLVQIYEQKTESAGVARRSKRPGASASRVVRREHVSSPFTSPAISDALSLASSHAAPFRILYNIPLPLPSGSTHTYCELYAREGSNVRHLSSGAAVGFETRSRQPSYSSGPGSTSTSSLFFTFSLNAAVASSHILWLSSALPAARPLMALRSISAPPYAKGRAHSAHETRHRRDDATTETARAPHHP